MMPSTTGYQHRSYVQTLDKHGTLLELPHSQGWLIQRAVAGSGLYDATGPYPLFSCQNWASLADDLDALEQTLVSIVLVADPFGDYTVEELRRCFPDVMRPFKDHFVTDLSRAPDDFVAENHRRNVRKALTSVIVRRCEPPERWAAQWVDLYQTLIQRHQISGPAAFSAKSLAAQLRVPGLVAWRAESADETVGMVLWYVQGSVGYYHLAAYSDEGYALRASFALFWRALEEFAADGLRWLNLGAGAGLQAREDGLTRFKRGWSTDTRPAYICGRILDRAAYNRLTNQQPVRPDSFFPAYRAGEVIR